MMHVDVDIGSNTMAKNIRTGVGPKVVLGDSEHQGQVYF